MIGRFQDLRFSLVAQLLISIHLMKRDFEELGCALEPISLPHDLVDLAVRAFTQEVLILKVDIIRVLFR